jgi:hypothetical protein
MTHLLLTGAGFSSNWGCWVADEVFEYLLAEPQLSPLMRAQLWHDKNSQGNYETTIQALRDAAVTRGGQYAEEYRNFLSILGGMFNQMRNAYVQSDFQFEKSTYRRFEITSSTLSSPSTRTPSLNTITFRSFFMGNQEAGGKVGTCLAFTTARSHSATIPITRQQH